MRSVLSIFLSFAILSAAEVSPQAPVAGGATSRDYPPLQAPPRTGVGIVQRKLSLDSAIRMALENNLEIEIEKTNVDTAKEQVVGARGFFDPAFRWVPLLQDNNTPTGSVLQGAGGKLNEKFMSQNFYVRQKLPWNGLQLNLDFENQRTSSTNPFSSFDPYLSSRLAFSIVQPLLRGRTTDPGRAQIGGDHHR